MTIPSTNRRLSIVGPGSLMLAASLLAACGAGVDDEVSGDSTSASVSTSLSLGAQSATTAFDNLWAKYLNHLKANKPVVQAATAVTTSARMAGTYASDIAVDQLHILHVGNGGTIIDDWRGIPTGQWTTQQLNLSGLTPGPAAVGGPAVMAFYRQFHAVYPDAAGTLWDAWYDGYLSRWNLQQINRNGVTTGPAAADNPVFALAHQQQHIIYPDASGILWDSWYDRVTSRWNLQRINLGGATAGPAATGTPVTAFYTPGKADQVHVVYTDASRAIWDSWYDYASGRWNLQQINLKGVTAGPAVAGNVAVALYNPCTDGDACPWGPTPGAEMHVVYRETAGKGAIWDSWYSPITQSWKLQNITSLAALSNSTGAVLATVHSGQFHIVTQSPDGRGLNAFYDPKTARWSTARIW